jgi:DNA-directed RNA polymerase subunit N (RpoN/RPB10)
MPCHVLCPSCGNGLGEVYDFIDLAKQGYYKSLGNKIPTDVKSDKLELIPNITMPIGFILDAAGLKLLCCRMHVLGVTNFDKVYK